ncbi:hypothetical protein NC651_015755 [Populus alba x Populus x berolinensis]|nr:hypothetical protein NC651_015755 [Populus alba x Populus x berolinensis]
MFLILLFSISHPALLLQLNVSILLCSRSLLSACSKSQLGFLGLQIRDPCLMLPAKPITLKSAVTWRKMPYTYYCSWLYSQRLNSVLLCRLESGGGV